MSFVKYRLKEVATDFGTTPKEIADIVAKYSERPKSNTQVLTEEELNAVFDHMTKNNQVSDLNQVFNVAPTKKPEAPRAEAPRAPRQNDNRDNRRDNRDNREFRDNRNQNRPQQSAAKPAAQPAAEEELLEVVFRIRVSKAQLNGLGAYMRTNGIKPERV